MPTDDERWSVQRDTSTLAGIQDFSEKCSARLTSRSTEEIHEEAINVIQLYIPLNVTFHSVHKNLKLSLVEIGSKSEVMLLAL